MPSFFNVAWDERSLEAVASWFFPLLSLANNFLCLEKQRLYVYA